MVIKQQISIICTIASQVPFNPAVSSDLIPMCRDKKSFPKDNLVLSSPRILKSTEMPSAKQIFCHDKFKQCEIQELQNMIQSW